MKQRKKKGQAYPEVVQSRGEQWTVHADATMPRVEYDKQRMFVPLDVTERDRQIRQHEETHLALDDLKLIDEALAMGTVDLTALNAVADIRVNDYCQTKCGTWNETLMPPEMLERFIEACKAGKVDKAQAAGMLAASRGLREADRIENATYPVLGDRDCMKVINAVKHIGASSRNDEILAAAEALTDLMNNDDEKSGSEDGRDDTETRKGKTEIPSDSDPFADMPDVSEIRERFDSTSGKWGEMTINRAPLTKRLPIRLRGRGKRATDTGAVAGHPHRALTDQRIFKGVGRTVGASVLIDVSGSMHLETTDIVALMHKYPAGIIAVYSGRGHRGELWIVANRGRMCAPSYVKQLGGNIVDGPALDWLATQKMPRYWICDGLVTGCGDIQAKNLNDEAKEKVRRNRIKRIDPAQFRKFLGKKGR